MLQQLVPAEEAQHRNPDNTPEHNWDEWHTRSSRSERSTRTTLRGRPVKRPLRRSSTCTRLKLPVQSPQRLTGICHGTIHRPKPLGLHVKHTNSREFRGEGTGVTQTRETLTNSDHSRGLDSRQRTDWSHTQQSLSCAEQQHGF